MTMDDKSALNGGKAFLWMLVIFGGWLIWSGMGETGKNPRAHWKNVYGEITDTSKKEAWSDSSGQKYVGPIGFDITIGYSYAVDGVSYAGVSTYYDGGINPEPKYRIHERVLVYYEPDSPGRSSLFTGYELVVTKEMKSANVISGTLILLSGLFFLILLRLKEAKQK